MALALVTGASSGIGFQLASQLADRGYDIVGVGASARITELGSRISGVEVIPVQADLATAEGIERVWAAVEATGRPLDVACLNAGRPPFSPERPRPTVTTPRAWITRFSGRTTGRTTQRWWLGWDSMRCSPTKTM